MTSWELDVIRERRERIFFDTVFSPDPNAPKNIDQSQFLFQNRHVGYHTLTNLEVGGCLSFDHSVVLRRMQCRAWFDTDDEYEAERMFSIVETEVMLSLRIGDKPFVGPVHFEADMSAYGFLPDEEQEADRRPGWTRRTFLLDFKKEIAVPTRQNMCVVVEASDFAMQAINEFSGMKTMRVYLYGVETREIA